MILSCTQIKALLKKDVLVRWRQPWMPVVQLLWPCLIFILLYLIRLKFGPQQIEDCQFPARLLPTKHNVLPGFYSYICTIENKCSSTKKYEEYPKYENAPMKPIIDIVQIFINNDRLFNSVVELPEKANFISAVTSIVTSGHMDDIRKNVEKVIDMVPQIEKMLNGSFDIKSVFSDRKTFVKSGYLLCGHPFPNTESIPLVNDILYSEDFSEINDDELKAMPTKYCKKLYLDVTSSNHGKLTWNSIKPIISGKILFAPDNEDTRSIMQLGNSTFEEINRLKILSVAVEQILVQLKHNVSFQNGLDSLLKLAQTPFVKSILGDEFNIDQVEAVINRIRTDPIIFDVISTIKNILECFSVDRFVPMDTEDKLHKHAFELNNQRLFYAAVYFNNTEGTNVVYKFHMDTDNTQPTIENKNRFWFPGPQSSMIRDMKYHRGFVQIKQEIDMGIIRHKKKKIWDAEIITEEPMPVPSNPFSVKVFTDDDDDEDDDDWFTSSDNDTASNKFEPSSGTDLLSSIFSGLGSLPGEVKNETENNETLDVTTSPNESSIASLLNSSETLSNYNAHIMLDDVMDDIIKDKADISIRKRRQSIFDLFSGTGSSSPSTKAFEVDNLKFFTQQFPYPAFTEDDFKTGLYLAQAVQVAFFLGLVAQISSCVRHLIWMRESKNSMIMRAMGLKFSSEISAWTIITLVELLIIFLAVCVILYVGGILMYTSFIFIISYLAVFGVCLISFCYMCSTFFTSATIGAVATTLLFFISYCPYIIVLLFDAHLSSLQNFVINLSFTTAFSHAWSHIMRTELQELGLSYHQVLSEGLKGEFGFSLVMIIFDTIIYIVIGLLVQRYKNDEFNFVAVHRENVDASVGATLTNVSKIYGNNKTAVSNINLSFPRNKVTCLLGRNGAGKSTIIKMLTGQVVQTSGRVVISQDMVNNSDLDKTGVCSQDNILIPTLTAREHLEMYAKIKLKHDYHSEVKKTLNSLKLEKYENYLAMQLSGGYQRRLCVALAFIGSPNVVILDEPCNGVDAKARKDIWDLIAQLRKGRAVVFATHFLDEAEYLSDFIVVMKKGEIIAKHNPETLKNYSTERYEISMQCCNEQAKKEITEISYELLSDVKMLSKSDSLQLVLEANYDQKSSSSTEFFSYLQKHKGFISDLVVRSKNLEHLFKDLDSGYDKIGNGHHVDMPTEVKSVNEGNVHFVKNEPLSQREAMFLLLRKRLTHFSRNYRMLLYAIVLPAIFEIIAMWFVAYRLEDDFDKELSLNRDLYPKSFQFTSIQNKINFTNNIYDSLKGECSSEKSCKEFPESEKAFYWILDTLKDYYENRYGGYTFNDTKAMVWYNNKGYHAMMAWLNDLNSHIFQTEMNDTSYTITSYNSPWKLGFTEITTSSILRQAGDSCMVFILLIAYSLVVAVASVYLVNERIKGEKLQQKLCGVSAATYWGVAFIWDFLVMLMAIMICTSIILMFGMPVFVDRQQIWGVIALAIFFAFACIPAVHVFEKCFVDASVAIVTVFCMNVIIPLFTMAIIVLLGVIGDSPTWDSWRLFLNRAFLVFPQHALGDGLLEICKNYMVAVMFKRFDIDSYKNPVNSDLLRPHFISLWILGIFFILLNVLLESKAFYRWKEIIYNYFANNDGDIKPFEELKIVSIQNTLKMNDKSVPTEVLKVENISKSYRRGQHALKDISFSLNSGECFGLLGKNGAGKSTMFKILSGEMHATSGSITYFDNEISYCPQTNTLDSLLNVEECIEFYGKLRRVKDISKLVTYILESYNLEPYRKVLVKNLSGGNRRKLTLATTCCGQTAVILMDEPTSDMDPVTRAIVYKTIENLLHQQRAIILTSHSISEIDGLCHRIAVLKDGRLIAYSYIEDLKNQFGGIYDVTVYCDETKTKEIITKLHEIFPGIMDVHQYQHLLKFNIRVAENNTDLHENNRETKILDLSLAELFKTLNILSQEYNDLRYTVNRCHLDMIFERILDSNEKSTATNCISKSAAVSGGLSTGYIHNGYIENETIT